MAYLQEIMLYKKKIMKILFNTSTIVNAIDSSKADEPDSLVWNNIFPVRRIPSVDPAEAKTYITISMTVPKVDGNMYKDVKIGFHIFTHESLQKMNSGYCRTDYLQSEVDQLFNGNENFGIDGLELIRVDELFVNEKYSGSSLWYNAPNLNQNLTKVINE